MQIVLHVLVLQAISHVLVMPIVFACISLTHYTLLVVPKRLQAVREDRFGKVLSEWPSDGPILTSSSLKHV